jgi:hypothetical protein
MMVKGGDEELGGIKACLMLELRNNGVVCNAVSGKEIGHVFLTSGGL